MIQIANISMKLINHYQCIKVIAVIWGFTPIAKATVTISTLDTPITIDFQAFNGSGLSPNPSSGQLDSDNWSITGLSDGSLNFGDVGTSGDFARGSSSSANPSTGGIYAFGTGSGNWVLGVQPGEDDFTPGAFTLRLENNTGTVISGMAIAYDIFIRNNEGRAGSFNFSWAIGSVGDPGVFTSLPLLNLTSLSTADLSPSWLSVNRSTFLSGLIFAPGSYFYARWTGNDAGGSGSRDEFGLDNISISAVPEPAPALVGSLLSTGLLRRNRKAVSRRADAFAAR